MPDHADDDTCTECGGSGLDYTWHEGATVPETHACGYCHGGTYSGRGLTTTGQTPSPEEQPVTFVRHPETADRIERLRSNAGQCQHGLSASDCGWCQRD